MNFGIINNGIVSLSGIGILGGVVVLSIIVGI